MSTEGLVQFLDRRLCPNMTIFMSSSISQNFTFITDLCFSSALWLDVKGDLCLTVIYNTEGAQSREEIGYIDINGSDVNSEQPLRDYRRATSSSAQRGQGQLLSDVMTCDASLLFLLSSPHLLLSSLFQKLQTLSPMAQLASAETFLRKHQVILILTKLYDYNLGSITESSLWRRQHNETGAYSYPSGGCSRLEDFLKNSYNDENLIGLLALKNSSEEIFPFLGLIMLSDQLRSTDYGTTYEKLNDKVGLKTILSYLYVCPTNKRKIMLLTDPEIESSLLISSDEGATYQKYRLNFYIQSLLFHPKQEDWILAYSQDQKEPFEHFGQWIYVFRGALAYPGTHLFPALLSHLLTALSPLSHLYMAIGSILRKHTSSLTLLEKAVDAFSDVTSSNDSSQFCVLTVKRNLGATHR
ncbi:hypothetical protein MJT46_018325 [Ovis ammon polii x Ovis aries]|nr:hypothetical protein MJT46_018325 [Ovis ammon polii x Ovis aries]